jgi:hypothetical protein
MWMRRKCDLTPHTDSATVGTTDEELNMFDIIFSGEMENLSNDVIS